MKNKLLLIITLIVATALVGCSYVQNPTGTVQKENIADIGDVHLRDKTLLYKNQDPSEVVTMYLTVSTGNSGENTNHTWEEINTYSVFDYEEMGVDRFKVEGLLQVGDKNGPISGELGYNQNSPNCTVQIRGQTSSANPQKNYKISIKDNKGQWRGQSTIALNKHQTEGLRFRNKLAFDLISGIDQMMGLRTTFVHLYVKDTTKGGNGVFTDYGIYTQVEQLNKTALKTHGLDKNGHLYKINFFEFYRYEDVIKLKDEPGYDVKAFEELLEIKGDDDHLKLITMLDKVNNYSVSIDKVLDEHFDIENLSYWMAFHILTGNIDTQSRNVYIYSPLNSDKWYFLSWDNDGSFKRKEHEITGRLDYSEWESGVSNYWGNVLFQRCLKSEKFRKQLDIAVNDLRKYMSEDRINGYVNKYTKVLKPYLFRMPDVMYMPVTSSQYDIIAGDIYKEVETNYNLYKKSYEKPMPFFIGVPLEQNGKITLNWDNSYDFDAENITYTFELARDCYFNEIIVKQENIMIPSAEFDKLPQGQYFVRIKAKNQSGESQYAFDSYVIPNGKLYGVKCFYVDENGKITEDS